MNLFFLYITASLVTALPILWLMLSAWMGVPIVWSEYVSLLGSLLLLSAAFVSLFRWKPATVISLIGSLCCWTFWLQALIESLKQGRFSAWSILIVATVYLSLLACMAVSGTRLFWRPPSNPNVSAKQKALVFIISALVAVSLGGAWWAQQKRSERHPCIYLIPNGYVGWVRVDFNMAGMPQLPQSGGAYQFRFPSNGVIETSSTMESGWATDSYFYYTESGQMRTLNVTDWGRGGMIWGNANGKSEEYFFVGTEEQLKLAPGATDDHGYPETGNQRQ